MIDIWFEMICLHDVLPIDFSINRLVSSLVSILNYIKCHRRFHINHSYAQYSPINYSAAQCNRQNNGCPLATQARWSSVYNNRRLLCSLLCPSALWQWTKKLAYRVDALASCRQLTVTVKAQTHQTKLNYQNRLKRPRALSLTNTLHLPPTRRIALPSPALLSKIWLISSLSSPDI